MLPEYHLIDLKTWPRREHFEYYRTALRCGYSLTARLEVGELVRYAKEHLLSVYPCFLYAISRAVNDMEEMKMMVTPEGTPGIWERVHPSFTIFHEEDKTFSDLWMEYCPNFPSFYQEYRRVLDRYGAGRGVKLRAGQPANFFCVSCVPWLDYTGYATHSMGEPALFPIVTFGKYVWTEESCQMPVTVTISHASADGYHTCAFFRLLQQYMSGFASMAEQT